MRVHLSCDNYEADKMKKDLNDKSLYSLCRMVPPGNLKFYFTVNDKKMVSSEVEVIDTEDYNSIPVFKCEDSIAKQCNVPKTNVIENIIKKDQLITKNYLTTLKARPRPKRRMKKPRPKSPWNISKSVFKTYQDDNEIKIRK